MSDQVENLKTLAVKKIDDLKKIDDSKKTQQDLFELETWLLVLLSGEPLAARLKSVRAEYQEVFGAEEWTKVQPTLQAVIAPDKDEPNRAEARRLQGELHWQASIRPWAAHTRERLTLLVMIMLVAVLVVAVILTFSMDFKLGSVLAFVGAVGGAVGSIQRIQTADLTSSHAFDLARHAMLQMGVVIAPFLGAIFALVLTFFVFSGSVSSGFIIPNVTVSCGTNCTCTVSNSVSKPTAPATSKTLIQTSTNGTQMKLLTNSILVLTNGTAVQLIENMDAVVVSNPLAAILPKEWSASEKADSCKYDFFSLHVCFASGKDLVLLILLAFVAGFSERLVPDLLTKLADPKKADAK